MDWCDGGPVGPLARLSYTLHKSLASELGQDTGYREVRTFSVAASAKPGSFSTSALGSALSIFEVCVRHQPVLLTWRLVQMRSWIGSLFAPVFSQLSLCRSTRANGDVSCGLAGGRKASLGKNSPKWLDKNVQKVKVSRWLLACCNVSHEVAVADVLLCFASTAVVFCEH